MQIDPTSTLPTDATAGTLVGRVWRPDSRPVRRRDPRRRRVRHLALVRRRCAICASRPIRPRASPARKGERIGDLAAILANTVEGKRDPTQALAARADRPAGREGRRRHLRDLAARTRDRGAGARRAGTRRAGARRSRERARRRGREDQARLAAGDGAEEAAAGRRACGRSISKSASGRTPRSSPSAQVLAAVGTGMSIGVLKSSTWNNPEPEVVVVATSKGKIVGATLGNDVNLRDVEGRSALLLEQGQGQQRLDGDRPVHPAVRQDLLARRRAPHAGARSP